MGERIKKKIKKENRKRRKISPCFKVYIILCLGKSFVNKEDLAVSGLDNL